MKSVFGFCVFLAVLTSTKSHASEVFKSVNIAGIGATLEKLSDGTLQVDALIPNAPAEQAGLQTGDIITEIKPLPASIAVDVRSISLAQAVFLIRGPIGTPVDVYYRRGQGGTTELSIVREQFQVDDEE